jgi:hypothetical protein
MQPKRERPPGESPAPPPSDAEWADAYAQGYAEGLREGLRELLQHASQGHTAAELRAVVKSRIARIPEDVERKRRNLLAPPRRSDWENLVQAPGARSTPGAPAAAPAPEGLHWTPGRAYLFREDRPRQAIEFARSVVPRHRRLLWISLEAAPPVNLPASAVEWLRPSAPRPGEEGNPSTAVSPGGIAGKVQAAGGDGGLLVYLDTLEYFRTEFGTELTLRFVNWMTQWVTGGNSTVIASADLATFPEADQRRLQRAFHILA